MESKSKILLFGEAEKGEFCQPYRCNNLKQLLHILGEPPRDSRGIHYAVQALFYNRELFYFRVKEEGYSYQDYFHALKLIKHHKELLSNISALCAPGVGESIIFDAMQPYCNKYSCMFISNESDLFDYLMFHRQLTCR